MTLTRKGAVLIGISALFVTPFSGSAQESDKKKDTIELDPVVLTQETKDSAKTTTSVIGSQTVERLHAATVPEILNILPGVDINGSARLQGQSINVMGFDDQEDVRVTIDGAQKDFEAYRQGTIFIEPELLKRAEVSKGAFDADHYGAFGGSVALETKSAEDMLEPGKTYGAMAKLKYASNGNELIKSLSAYGKSEELGVHVLGALTHRKNDDFVDGAGDNLFFSGAKVLSGHVKASLEREDHFVELSALSSFSDDVTPWASKRGSLPSPYNIRRYGREGAYRRMSVQRELRDSSASLKYRYSPDNPLIDLAAKVTWAQTLQKSERLDKTARPYTSQHGDRSETNYQTYGFDLRNMSSFEFDGADLDLSYGYQFSVVDRKHWSYYDRYKNDPDKNYGLFAPYYYPEGQQTVHSAWLEGAISLQNGLTITPGLRYDVIKTTGVPNLANDYNTPVIDGEKGDDYGTIWRHGISPSLSLDYEINENLSFFAGWAKKQRAPIFDEIYDTDSIRYRTSNELKSEWVDAKRVGFNFSAEDVFSSQDYLSGRALFYHNQVTDNIGRTRGDYILGDPSPTYTNKAGYNTAGVELELYYSHHNFFGAVTYAKGFGKMKGTPLSPTKASIGSIGVAPEKLGLMAGYKFPEQGVTLGWRGSFVGERHHEVEWMEGGAKAKGYSVHNLFVKVAPQDGRFKGVEFTAAIDNVFNKAYRPFFNGYYAKGTNLKASVAYKF
ncbi:TonB-dependent receptor domain-containing protein [Polycladidibacter hongkongensis]|uniref:TonB-dependent receptor domain-containing protein n=1 Tax=Polycladidibacter hongkongensis TaxID=1647556 RepID=UPI0008298C21|nr:TonB-dependent receptor [Pseudovibrio hongkongensis]